METGYKRTKFGCYTSCLFMAVVTSLSPLLFVIFHDTYQISYSLLGFLAVICFGMQLSIDLIFTFFASKFNIEKVVKFSPVFSLTGILIYSLMPVICPGQTYLWVALGTIIFSVSAGLSEVLISPVIAAMPSDNPAKDMSALHSVYAWGIVSVVIISTLLLRVLGDARWYLVALFWSVLPLLSFIFNARAKIPEMSIASAKAGEGTLSKSLLLCVFCIFLGGASECTMTHWASSFLEESIGIPKLAGDILGLAVFGALLGLGRTLYAKYGKNILNTLIVCMTGTLICYLLTAVGGHPAISLTSCVLIGFFSSMLWPGTLILMEEKHRNIGVAAYAFMAAGGDAGGSLGPQLVGSVTDWVAESQWGIRAAEALSMHVEQFSMKIGLLSSLIFPICGVLVLLYMKRFYKKNEL